MPWYRWLAAVLLGLAAFWPMSAFIAFALWQKYFKEPWEDEKKEWLRALKLGPIGLLQVIGVVLSKVAVFVWLLADGVRTGDLRVRQSVRWLLMPIAIPIDLAGIAVWWTLLWIWFTLDAVGLTRPYRPPRRLTA